MKFTETPLKGAFVIDLETRGDDRGFFARTFCAREFAAHGLKTGLVQGNMSFSRIKGTLRGLHFQLPPAAETKLVRCNRGALFDVIVDLRPESPTCTKWFGVELTADNRRALYVPENFAHGFMTLVEDTEAAYLVGEYYSPEHERGYRYNDPAFGIEWPGEVKLISPKDERWPDFVRA
ncbi:MAG: dTDP-4-dehydrorhamnose 3,5-epimerase [Opitutaceae bacterium]